MAAKPAPSKPSIAIFDMGGVLLDWNPRHLYRKLIAQPDEMERFLSEVTTMPWHVDQDHGGDPAAAIRRRRSGGGDPAPAGAASG
jgi:2-haloacid dehalogenase